MLETTEMFTNTKILFYLINSRAFFVYVFVEIVPKVRHRFKERFGGSGILVYVADKINLIIKIINI